MGASEKQIVRNIKKYLDSLDKCFCYKTHGGAYESLKGQPDISGCTYGLRFDFEVKKPGKELRPIQKSVIRKFRRAGSIADVVHSVEEVEDIMDLIIDCYYITNFEPVNLQMVRDRFTEL